MSPALFPSNTSSQRPEKVKTIEQSKVCPTLMTENMLAEAAGPDQHAAKKMRPGHCTKKIPSRESWGDLSRDRYIICPRPPSPAGKILDRRQLFFLAVPPWPVIKRLCPSRTIFSAWRWSSESLSNIKRARL